MSEFWSDEQPGHTGPPLTDALVRAAEESLGYKLPESYVRLLRIRNGGRVRHTCFPTSVPTSWSPDHIEITDLFGIGYDWGIDGSMGSRYMIPEWGYPDVGILIADTPSAGHDCVMLDYNECGPRGEPRVIHVDTEYAEGAKVLVLAPSFEGFIAGLVDGSRYGV